jgi:hypothetical protein
MFTLNLPKGLSSISMSSSSLNYLNIKNLVIPFGSGNPVEKESTNNWIPGQAGNDENGDLIFRFNY